MRKEFWKAKNAEGQWEIGEGDEVLAVVQKRALAHGFRSDTSEDQAATLFQRAPELVEALDRILGQLHDTDVYGPYEVAERLSEVKRLARDAMRLVER